MIKYRGKKQVHAGKNKNHVSINIRISMPECRIIIASFKTRCLDTNYTRGPLYILVGIYVIKTMLEILTIARSICL